MFILKKIFNSIFFDLFYIGIENVKLQNIVIFFEKRFNRLVKFINDKMFGKEKDDYAIEM